MKRQTQVLTSGIFLWLTLAAPAAVRYVDLNNPTPAPPYATWSAAATNIQDAIDIASAGDEILVTNGVYRSGGRVVSESTTNRVAVTNAVTLRSVNGPAVTLIEGHPEPGTTNGPSAVRCVYLASGAALAGFTLTNGATLDPYTGADDLEGGGVRCESVSAVVSNCVLVGNTAWGHGGGAYAGTLNNCLITGNWGREGGGAFGGTMNNCIVSGNSSPTGGGVALSILNNCTVTSNLAYVTHSSGSGLCGGVLQCECYNCVIYDNDAPIAANYSGGFGPDRLFYCCTSPLPGSGFGNITNAPLFVEQASGNLSLQSNSPCINSGNNRYAPSDTDLAGRPRIAGGKVDIGAYELQNPSSVISFAWLQQYGLPSDGSADFTDPDGDHMNNWQEWLAGTDPSDASSVLKMLSPTPGSTPSSVLLSWQSVITRTYFLQRATDLTIPHPFVTIASDIIGQQGATAYEDSTEPGPAFYRVWTDPEKFFQK